MGRRKRELLLILGAFLLVIFLAGLQTYLSGLHRELPISGSLLVFILISINVFILLLLCFLVFRNVVKLILERRQKVLGSKLRTKLVVALVALSLVPGMILFFVSAFFIAGSLERWFSFQVERSLQESLEVSQRYYRDATSRSLHLARQISKRVGADGLLWQGEAAALKELIGGKTREYGVEAVEAFSSEGRRVAVSFDSAVAASRYVESEPELVRLGLSGKEGHIIRALRQDQVLKVVVPVYSREDPGTVEGAVVVNHFISGGVQRRVGLIAAALKEYEQFLGLKGLTKWSYLTTLLVVTLVVIMSSTLFGVYLARGITEPIQRLAEGTRRVAEGDLDFRLEATSDDEVGYLVNSFNRMTADLRVSKAMVERASEELRLSNLELESRREHMEIILKNVAAGVIAIDQEGHITIINKSAEEMLAIKSLKVLGVNFREVLSPRHMAVVKDLLRDLRHSREGFVRRQVQLPLPGRTLNLLVCITILRDEQGEYKGMVVVLDDLSQLLKAQRMAAWREVARKIAHEIKNPLTPIQLSAQRLRKRFSQWAGEDRTVFEECTETIIKQVDELKALVNEFSKFARMPQVTTSPNNINDVISEALVLFRGAHREVEFQFDADESVPIFDLDRDQMKRVMFNLLDNAVVAVDGRGEVTVSTKFDPTFQLVTVVVADNGHGLPPGDRARLFEPYFSTKESGTGLGLAIVSNIIADHNGYVKIEENEPRGTRVIMELPIRVV